MKSFKIIKKFNYWRRGTSLVNYHFFPWILLPWGKNIMVSSKSACKIHFIPLSDILREERKIAIDSQLLLQSLFLVFFCLSCISEQESFNIRHALRNSFRSHWPFSIARLLEDNSWCLVCHAGSPDYKSPAVNRVLKFKKPHLLWPIDPPKAPRTDTQQPIAMVKHPTFRQRVPCPTDCLLKDPIHDCILPLVSRPCSPAASLPKSMAGHAPGQNWEMHSLSYPFL